MDAECGRHPIGEVVDSVCSVELLESPLEAHRDHDCVAGDDFDLAVGRDVELEEVLDAHVSVLSAAFGLGQLGIASRRFVPVCVRLLHVVSEDCVRSGASIWDLNLDSTDVRIEHESHAAGGCAGEVQRVVAERFDLHWEAREALLTRVESVPNVVHHTVDLVVIIGHLVRQVNWLDRAVLTVRVERLKEQDSQVAIVAPGS